MNYDIEELNKKYNSIIITLVFIVIILLFYVSYMDKKVSELSLKQEIYTHQQNNNSGGYRFPNSGSIPATPMPSPRIEQPPKDNQEIDPDLLPDKGFYIEGDGN